MVLRNGVQKHKLGEKLEQELSLGTRWNLDVYVLSYRVFSVAFTGESRSKTLWLKTTPLYCSRDGGSVRSGLARPPRVSVVSYGAEEKWLCWCWLGGRVWASAGTMRLCPLGSSLCRRSARPEHTVTPAGHQKNKWGHVCPPEARA